MKIRYTKTFAAKGKIKISKISDTINNFACTVPTQKLDLPHPNCKCFIVTDLNKT